MILVAALLGTGVGALLGLLGGGGSLLAVPLLVFGLGLSPKEAVPVSLAAVGLAALGAAAVRGRAGDVDVPSALRFGLLGAAASLVGARAGLLLDGRTQSLLFAGVAFAAALRMVKGGRRIDDAPGRAASWAAGVAAALGAGFLTGLLGVGGGFLLVPALTLVAGLPLRRAVGTSLLVLGGTALAGLAGAAGRLPTLSPAILAFVAAAALAGPAAALVAGRVPRGGLRLGFAALLFLVSAATLLQGILAGSA